MSEKLKVLILNGSPRVNGNTSIAVRELESIFTKNGVEVDTIQIGAMDIHGCIGYNTCFEWGKCVFDDISSHYQVSLLVHDRAKPESHLRLHQLRGGCLFE